MSTVCLNMIVKNEAAVIRRCLESVADHIQSWVISDTGSTDGTQDIIREFFAERGIPGKLVEHEWVDFGTNRNLALQALESDHGFITGYILFMDADDYLVVDAGSQLLPPWGFDGFMVPMEYGGLNYALPKLVRAGLPWHWKGAVHEYLHCDYPSNIGLHSGGCRIVAATEGARSQNPNKYKDDAAMLARDLATDPSNPRTWFYLAQSWRDAGDDVKAQAFYSVRAGMKGWDEEDYIAKLELARVKERLGHPVNDVITAYLGANDFRPSRAESLCSLIFCLRNNGLGSMAGLLMQLHPPKPLPSDILFVERQCYAA